MDVPGAAAQLAGEGSQSGFGGRAFDGYRPERPVTLEVIGRTSGRAVSLPLVVVIVDGQRYLASMLGEDAQWVRNGRAAGGQAVIRSAGQEQVQLEEVPRGSRAHPNLRAYLGRAPGARPHVPVREDAPLGDFEEIAAAFPVFRAAAYGPVETGTRRPPLLHDAARGDGRPSRS